LSGPPRTNSRRPGNADSALARHVMRGVCSRPAGVRLFAAHFHAATIAILLLAGCEVGPTYRRPELPAATQFASQATSQPAVTSIAPPADWWKLFQDVELDHLIADANANNQNVRQAVARVDEARALARIAASYLLPTVTLDPTFTRSHESGSRVNPLSGARTPQITYNDWLVPFDLRYEVDVWGRLRRQFESAAAQARASQFDLGAVRLTIDADVAIYYIALRSLDAQSAILNGTVNAYKEQVRIVSVQLKNGLITETDLYQATAQLQAALAQLRDTQRARADEEHALATLCGRAAPLFAVAANPLANPTPPVIPPGLPAQLLVRRPDVAEAEQNVIAANAEVGVAVADFYPAFTLTGSAGFESASFTSIFDWQSKIASIGPSISLPIFEGGRLANNLDYQKAKRSEAAAAYVNQVLTAYGDVEDSLSDLHALSDEVGNLRQAVDASVGYRRVSNVQYQRGLVNYLIVIDAERTLLSNQLTLAQTINQQMAASVHLIQALGGGWTPPERSSP